MPPSSLLKKYAELHFYGGCGLLVVGRGSRVVGGRGGNTSIPLTITRDPWW